MKNFLLLLTIIFSLNLPTQKPWQSVGPVERISIRSNQLPIEAQTFINTLFPSIAVESAIHNVADDVFDVTMSNGCKITFDDQDNWLEINAPDNAMFPCGIIEQIVETDVFISLLENEIFADGVADNIRSISCIPDYGYVFIFTLPNKEEDSIVIDIDGNIWGKH